MAREPRHHPLTRSPLVDRLNTWLDTAWSKGWLPRPTLDPDILWRKAEQSVKSGCELSGRDAEDALDFRQRLAKLTESLETEARLNPLGQTIAHGQLGRVIRQRLRLGKCWRDRPERTALPVAPPILVIGQMRAGTTRIHRLLAADPAHSATRFCDSWYPVPEMPDMRMLRCALALFGARRIDPWIDTIHPFGASRVDEEIGWLASALNHCAYEAQWRIPSFTRFSEEACPAACYREFARILATDAARHGNAALPRVMKVPQFAEDLPALLTLFPDARIVVARRASCDVLRSTVSLVANQMTIQSDEVDLGWIEQEWQRKLTLRDKRISDSLARFSGPIAHVDFAALEADWETEIRSVYEALHLRLTPAAMASMRHEQHHAKTSPHLRHAQDVRAFQSA